MRKLYGNTWWGKQWLNALAEIDYSNRLPRGRTYANKGLVQYIDIQENQITAEVQGSRKDAYRVTFTIPKFTRQEQETIIELIKSKPLYLSQLLNRKLPTALHQTCTAIGIDLFPSSWNDLEGQCSCPDWAVPCKHMAAVLYLLANEIDQNPFLIFDLHGLALFKKLEETGYAIASQKEIPILSISALQQEFSLSTSSSNWEDELYQQIDFSGMPNCQEDLLRILSDQAVFYPIGDFKSILQQAYTSISRRIASAKNETPTRSGLNLRLDQVEAIEILLDEQADFYSANIRNRQGDFLFSFDQLRDFVDWIKKIPFATIDQFSVPVKALVLLWRFATQLVQHAAYIPQLLKIDANQYKIRWIAARINPSIRSIHDGIKSIVPTDILYYKKGKEILEPIEEDQFTALLSFLLSYLVHSNHKLDRRFREHKIGHLFFNGAIVGFPDDEEKEYPAAIQLWLHQYFMAKKQFVPVIQVDEAEEGFLLNIAIQDTSKALASLVSLQELLTENKFQAIRLEVLRDLALLAEYFPQINELVSAAGQEALYLDTETFTEILFKILPTIRLFGIKVLLPKALQKLLRPKLSIALNTEGESGIVQKQSMLQLREMLQFEWQVAIGDQLLQPKEFLKLVDQFSGIVKLNDQYVFFDEKEVALLIDKLDNPPALPKQQLLHHVFTEDYHGAKIALTKQLKKLSNGLASVKKVDLPKGLRAELRPYQSSGYQWLYRNAQIGFGSLIADDMGLGKTLQVITTLLKLKEEGALEKEKALVIVPTTLLTNWRKEINKFAPALTTQIYHGAKRKMVSLEDVTLTSYGVVRTDLTVLQKRNWKVIVLDEAQNIKNATTTQAKAVKSLTASIKIAMSGTPVENRLSEYWSIFDFVNPAYLGNLSSFKENYARPIELNRDQVQLEKFKKITQAFLLRRLKSDRTIIKDLPKKIEKDQFCKLSREQSALYQNVVNSTLATIEKAEGIARKGLVLKLLTSLKQICNHPKQFLKKGPADPSVSGKSMMLLSLMQTILENGEKTLIFTQYQEMGKILVDILAAAFGLEVPFLHGGVSRKRRDEMVETFQQDRATRVMILSLKAGGTGLNLTAASNVIHYDLWWNPAVEAQATDRAYRIGQQNNVMVHRFITQASFEEKINELLQKKKELANLTVTTGEKWIGELSDQELKNLLILP